MECANCAPRWAHSPSTESSSEQCEPNKQAYKVHRRLAHPSAADRALSNRSALPPVHCPLWAVLFCLTYAAAASFEPVALRSSRLLSSSASSWPTSSSPLEPLLALNSSTFSCSKEDLHHILTPLTEEEHDLPSIAFHGPSQDGTNRTGRSKRDVSRRRTRAADDNAVNEQLERAKKHRNKKMCYKGALKKCGRIFVNSYRFVRVKRNKDNDIMIAQCALRTAFFDCLKARADSCNINPNAIEQPEQTSPEQKDYLEKRKKRKEKKDPNSAKPNKNPKDLAQKFKNKLADTIWASRVCIFRQNIQG